MERVAEFQHLDSIVAEKGRTDEDVVKRMNMEITPIHMDVKPAKCPD